MCWIPLVLVYWVNSVYGCLVFILEAGEASLCKFIPFWQALEVESKGNV
jgi:hypothetical protein